MAQQIVGRLGRRLDVVVPIDPVLLAAALLAFLLACIVDEDAAHGLGRGGVEVHAPLPHFLTGLALGAGHQPEICLMNESGRIERLAGLFPG